MPANHVVLASGAVVAVSVAVAAAIAMYESPELRRYADDVRRRIAIALHSIGDGINPPHREPLFNRPEDLDGFLESRRGAGAEPGVDADEETRRRQREELLYWNSQRLNQENEKQEGQLEDHRPQPSHRGSSFDDFLRPDENAERGTYVFNSGSEVRSTNDGLRRRGDGVRGFSSSVYANPFADEFHLGADELEDEGNRQIAPSRDEEMSDIYSANLSNEPRTTSQEPVPTLIDVETEPAPASDAVPPQASSPAPAASHTDSSATLERELADNEYVTAGQENRDEAYASIQAWAETSNPSFYSPLPTTPVASVSALSEASADIQSVSEGEMTPTDSMSVIDAADVDAVSRDGDNNRRLYDVMSESEGIATPGSWSEVGSVISENDIPLRA